MVLVVCNATYEAKIDPFTGNSIKRGIQKSNSKYKSLDKEEVNQWHTVKRKLKQ